MSQLIKNIFDIKRSESYIEYCKYHTGNIFGITKVSRWELMHSNFIAWVLDSNASHSLHYYPLYQFISSLSFIKGKIDNEKARLDDSLMYKFYDEDFIVDAVIGREINNVDILIEVTTKDKILPILIENKVDSKENGKGGSQTTVYFRWGESKYSDRTKYYEPIYIFLFPEYNSKIIQKEEKYLRMTYQELVDYVIEPSMLKCGDSNSINNFKVYLQCMSFQADNEKGEYTMAISNEERKILEKFIKENKNLLCSVLGELKDDVDPDVLLTITSTVRDYSTYQFNGEEYRKNKLVLAVVKKYADDNNPKDFAELQNAFPDKLQGSKKGVVKLLNDISNKDKGIGGQKRYFVDTNDTIKLGADEIAVCTQWGADNISVFIDHVNNNLGYTITKA